jgi:arylsulfatase A-like enzyme
MCAEAPVPPARLVRGLVLPVLAALAGAGTACRARPAIERVVLVSIDTLRPDHLGAYGYARPTSPVLDALAARGVLFEDASSPSPWTLPAHASLLTGLYPGRHGVKGHDRYLPAAVPTLASLLGRAGWTTAAVVNSHNLGPRFGLDRGFQQFLYVEEVAAQRAPTTRLVDQALAWLRRHRDRPFFLFLHSYDVHSDYASLPEHERAFASPYDGPADGTTAQLIAFREGRVRLSARDAPHLVDLYDAGIRQMDAELGRLLSALSAEGLAEGTLLVVTSDHGEEFFEHGGVLHGCTQYEEVVRVPLVVSGPGVAAGRRVAVPASLLDVMPTVLGRLGVAFPPGLDGEDLGGLLSGGARPGLAERVLFGEADHHNVEHDITRAARRASWKLHFNRLSGEAALFDLRSDPGERTDLAPARPEVARELRSRLDRFLLVQPAAPPPAVTLSPQEVEKLRSLGYVR